jgi:pimeloyl-ACP methyl ester carboxylesterase
MTIDRVLGRLRRAGPVERMRILTIGGRAIRVATREGTPGWPRLLLCNGIGASLELFQPFVDALDPRRPAASIASELYAGSARDDPALARDLLHATTRLGPARGYYYQLLSSFGWTSLPRLPKLRQPTLILAGDDDPVIPLVNARIMDRLIPHSQLHVYHGGHLELAAHAERIAPVVEAFLGQEGADDVTGG